MCLHPQTKEVGMKRLTSLFFVATLCAATLAPVPAKALTDAEKTALAALLLLGASVAAAKHGKHNNSTSNWDEDRHGEPFSPSPGIVCLPRPKQCYQNGAISWRWTQRMFG